MGSVRITRETTQWVTRSLWNGKKTEDTSPACRHAWVRSEGNTRTEALNNIGEAIELYIEDCREAGDQVPSEAGKELVEIEAT